jgi:hypothetical protein
MGSAGNANYAMAKAAIAALTVSIAREMGKYGVRSNFIAPRARTRMTMSMPNHAMFDEPESGFDTMHPAWPAELVTFLASEHVDFNGQGFIVWGGQVVLVQGWHVVNQITKDGAAITGRGPREAEGRALRQRAEASPATSSGRVLFRETHRRLVLRVLAADVAVEDPEPIHVGAHVAARDEDGADAADLPLVVEERADDRHPGGAGDVVEARLPVRRAAPRAGRRHDQEEALGLAERLRRLLDQVPAPARSTGMPPSQRMSQPNGARKSSRLPSHRGRMPSTYETASMYGRSQFVVCGAAITTA